MSEPRHPDQPVYLDSAGVARFKPNAIVQFLLDRGPFDLNAIACRDWEDPEDYTQLMQLIGYSVSGYGGLSTSPPERVERADREVERLLDGGEGEA